MNYRIVTTRKSKKVPYKFPELKIRYRSCNEKSV